MTQADRVHSTPPTNTPVDTTRRRLLTAVAGGAVAVMAISTTAQAAGSPATADPIFAVIEAHRVAHDAHWAAINEAGNLMDWGAITEKPCHDDNDAFELLIGAPANTLPGLQAKLTYLRAIAEGEEAWMLDEREGTALNLIDSFTASLKNIGVRS